MRKPKKSKSFIPNVIIYQQEINLEYEYNVTFFLITEIVNGKPLHTYYYEIPESYKDNRLLGELHERYAPFCPN